MKRSLTVVLALGFWSLWAMAVEQVDVQKWYDFKLIQSPPKTFEGPFRCDAVAFYLVHHGGPLDITLKLERTEPDPMDARLVRLFDPDEKLLEWRYKTYWSTEPPDETFAFRVENGKPGVYILRVVTRGKVLVHLKTEPKSSFGLFPMRTRLYATKPNQFKECYIYVPPRAEKFVLDAYGSVNVSLADEKGETLATLNKTGKKEIDIARTQVVWKLSARLDGDNSRLRHRGFPMILCPDEATARNIRGSVEFAPDGTLLYHKCQLAMWRWMRSLKPEDLAIEPRPLADLEEEWLKPPVPPKAYLLGSYGAMSHMAKLVRCQNLNPKSMWYGCLEQWKEFEPMGEDGRWDREASFKKSTVNTDGWPSPMAVGYWLDKPFNPYRKDEKLRSRIALAAFADLLKVHEDGTLKNGSDSDMISYSSITGFPFNHNYIVPYGLVAKDMPEEARGIWTEGIRLLADRYPFHRVSCENQSSHWPIGQYLIYMGSGVEGYKQMAHDFIVGMDDPMYNPFMKTGYQQEAYGPDSTYQGLGSCLQATYYRYSRDAAAKDGLRTIYNFFNHTVAPEPDGTVWGANNFAHRTKFAWQHPQYGAGLLQMAGELPEAGVWKKEKNLDNPELAKKSEETIRAWIGRTFDDAWYQKHGACVGGSVYAGPFFRYLFYPKRILPGKLPVLQSDRFDKNFNDEFIAIRRPTYYALTYVGRTAHEWTKSHRQMARDKPYRRSGGGLSLFWTPAYGSGILSMNYSALANHMVRADVEGNVEWEYKGKDHGVSPKCSWPDYFSLEHTYDPETHTLVATTRMVDLPIALKRTTVYEEDGVRQVSELAFRGDVRVLRLVENIPLLLNKEGLRLRFQHAGGAWKDQPGPGCTAAWVGNGKGNGVLFTFDQPVTLALGPDANQKWYRETQKMKPLEVDLGNEHKKGEHVTVTYRISAAKEPK
ncbi:MAG: hypothetical protein GXP25_21780 [Planctomycetes bacterium]|nr:hypothetical protein [Planctomycetota bacterium]